MAAKKSTAKKNTNQSKVVSNKNVKKAAVKNTSSNKVTKKTAVAKKTVKDTKATATKENKSVEKKFKPISALAKPKNNLWAIMSFVLLIAVLVFVLIIGWMYLGNSSSDEDLQVDLVPTPNGSVKLLIVEDPTCTNCQVDLFADQVKANLIPELIVEKVSYESTQGKAIVKVLGLKQVPAYFFSEGIDKREDWVEQLSGAFIEQDLGGQKYYMLNPQFIPNKVMVEEPIVLENSIIIGDVNAPVTLIEFTDFECPFCAIAEGNAELVEQFKVRDPNYVPAIPKIMEEYVETGKVRIVFYNYPTAQLHPLVRYNHLAALCANEQGKFEEFSRYLWDNVVEWSSKPDRVLIMKEYAQILELDQVKFDECLDTAKYNSQIQDELALAQEYGVSGTPAFFVGKSFISGAQGFEVFQELIEAELAK